MIGETVVDGIRIGWLTLAFMMLASRIVFQAAGAERMRLFLEGWQQGRVKRVWGAAALAFATYLALTAALEHGALSVFEKVLVALLIFTLVGDGLVNVLPAGFDTFKSRLQDAWVRRNQSTGREADRYLFGTVNAVLAVGAVALATVVIAYKPIAAGEITVSVGTALVLTAILVGASTVERRHSRQTATAR